ncbi:AMP-binding enzyme, partial [Sansalvadorimonas verongulae]|uniref:AMP-binding enzyme n=1 Tax=Sansalvadorimonas verongulae TaxID=2172824 RepID=UPI0012BBEB6C
FVAWYTARQALSDNTLQEQLRQQLPQYMVPVAIVFIEKLPLSANGKLDLKALPIPKVVSTAEYVAPSTDTEQHLCILWQELLHVEQVGIDDNFFH